MVANTGGFLLFRLEPGGVLAPKANGEEEPEPEEAELGLEPGGVILGLGGFGANISTSLKLLDLMSDFFLIFCSSISIFRRSFSFFCFLSFPSLSFSLEGASSTDFLLSLSFLSRLL